jgi:hypothetical protein
MCDHWTGWDYLQGKSGPLERIATPSEKVEKPTRVTAGNPTLTSDHTYLSVVQKIRYLLWQV